MKKQTSFRLSDTTMQRLDVLAECNGMDRTEIITQLIRQAWVISIQAKMAENTVTYGKNAEIAIKELGLVKPSDIITFQKQIPLSRI